MDQPVGFEKKGSEHLVCRLHKSLYGLKQAPRAWFDKLKEYLIMMDDIIVTGSNKEEIEKLITVLNNSFSLKDLGQLNYFQGIEVKTTTEGLHLSQKRYIKDLLIKSKMDNAKPLPTPMVSSLKLIASDGDPITNATEYKSIVGALQYITITRPEIAFSVNKVCQFMQSPLDEHMKAVKRILRYLKGTLDEGIYMKRSQAMNLTGFCDADWGNDLCDKRSTTGYCFYLGNNVISWSSKKQHVVSRFSTEVEYRSLANATSELLWLQSLLAELKVQVGNIPMLWCDNMSTISLSANPVLHSRTKHIELDLYFVREKVIAKEIEVNHVPSVDQVADVFTKPLSAQFFQRMKKKLIVTAAGEGE
ncbi:hypothetical protein UlMin_044401 [Ulmus minor]